MVRAECSSSIDTIKELKEELEGTKIKVANSNSGKIGSSGNSSTAAETSNHLSTISALKEEVEKLKYRLRDFQRASGLDHIESETRVRHERLVARLSVTFLCLGPAHDCESKQQLQDSERSDDDHY